MDYTNILTLMRPELTLIAILVFSFIYDLVAAGRLSRRWFGPVVCVLLVGQLVILMTSFVTGSCFGGMFETAKIHTLVKCLLTFGTILVFLQANEWLVRDDTIFKEGEFYVLTLSTLLGMYFMVSAGHFLMFVIGLELASIPMACLVAFDKYRHNSAEAGAKFIVCALFASGLMLYGISLLYGTVGTLYFEDMPAGLTGSPLQVLGMVFFIAGLGFKLSLVPFHLWTADAYEGAPTSVTAYLSVVSKAAAAFSLMAILVKVFEPMIAEWQTALWIMIVLSITIANLFAIRQENLKRFMAYSSISQAGYIMLAVITGDEFGMGSLIFYLLVYMAANLAVFGVMNTVVQNDYGKMTFTDYDGFYSTNPKLALIMTLALFSLAGIPPFAGFFSKFFVFAAAFKGGFSVLVFIALINTVISLFYYLKLVKAMFINRSETPIPYFRSSLPSRINLGICLAGILAFGLVSSIFDGIMNLL